MEKHEFNPAPLPSVASKAENISQEAAKKAEQKAVEKKKSKFSEETLRGMSDKMMGNNNATKNKPFRDMLTRKIIQNPVKLEKIVDKLLKEAERGEAWAAKEVFDRLDGKAVMTQEISGVDGAPIEVNGATNFTDELLKEILATRQKESK
jgi:hypothetical protein